MSSPIVVRVPYVYRSHGFCTDFFYSTSKSSGSRCRVAANCGGYGTAYNTPLLCMNRCIELNAKTTAFYMVSVNGCGCSQTTSGMCTMSTSSSSINNVDYLAYEIIGTSFSEVRSCSSCPAGTFTSVPNDETSCELCPRGKSSNAGSTSCDLTTIKLPNGNGEHSDGKDGTRGAGAAKRVGSLGGIIDDYLFLAQNCWTSAIQDMAWDGNSNDPGVVSFTTSSAAKTHCEKTTTCSGYSYSDYHNSYWVYNNQMHSLQFYSGWKSWKLESTCFSKRAAVTKTYGPIENWDVSAVTNMKYAFWEQRTFNGIISSWDTSSVTDMYASTFKYIPLYKCSSKEKISLLT